MNFTQRFHPGQLLEGFTLLTSLGEGGFSRVYRARTSEGIVGALKLAKSVSPNPYSGGTLALHFAQPIAFHTGGIGPAPLEPNLVLARESMMLEGLADPLFPRVLRSGMLADRQFIFYEELTGGSLRDRMVRREPIPMQLFVEIGWALADRQKRRLLPFHGDLKPENIMFDAQGSWHLIDPSCAVADGTPLGSRSFVTTPIYYPFLFPDDRLALSLMIIEALTGVLITSPEASCQPSRLTERLERYLTSLEGMGRGRYLSALRRIPRIDELSILLSNELARILLQALYLQFTPDGRLDLGNGYPDWETFLNELSLALGRDA